MDISGVAASSAALTLLEGRQDVALGGIRQEAGAEQSLAQVVDEQARAAAAQAQGRGHTLDILA